MFGPHLMLDCYGCNKEKLKNSEFVLNFLGDMARRLDMHIIQEPFIVNCESSNSWDNGGVSAVVIIAESHISMHTFPDNDGYMSLDMFSCKEFSIEKVLEHIKLIFNPEKIEKNLVMRGRHFPKEKYRIEKIVEKQRLVVQA